MGRLGRPADIGNAVSLLCSAEAAWITGTLMEVDGGASLVDAHLPLEFQGIAKAKPAEVAWLRGYAPTSGVGALL